jgi:hypothetical protein
MRLATFIQVGSGVHWRATSPVLLRSGSIVMAAMGLWLALGNFYLPPGATTLFPQVEEVG